MANPTIQEAIELATHEKLRDANLEINLDIAT